MRIYNLLIYGLFLLSLGFPYGMLRTRKVLDDMYAAKVEPSGTLTLIVFFLFYSVSWPYFFIRFCCTYLRFKYFPSSYKEYKI